MTTARRVPWIDRTQPFLHGTSVHHFCTSFEKPSILWNPGVHGILAECHNDTNMAVLYQNQAFFSAATELCSLHSCGLSQKMSHEVCCSLLPQHCTAKFDSKKIPQGIGSGATQKFFRSPCLIGKTRADSWKAACVLHTLYEKNICFQFFISCQPSACDDFQNNVLQYLF